MRRSLFNGLRISLAAVALLCVSLGRAQAQNATIRGVVNSARGGPVEGAYVYIAELGLSASTGAGGAYSLVVPSARVRGQALSVRVRAIGFKPRSEPITLQPGPQTINFTMDEDINRLEEIVVTGVLEGTEQTRVPFSVGRIDVADVEVPAVNALSLLSGRVAGATVINQTGLPGAAPTIQLRAPTMINASGRGQDPLFIVDGVEIVGGLQDINTTDIESIEVVKGAAAASLYGARAGAGVVQITTKSARRAAPGVSFSLHTEYGTSDIERQIKLSTHSYLLMDPAGKRYCIAVPGQPMCSRTLDWATELKRVNWFPGPDSVLTPQPLALDVSSTYTNNLALKNNFEANPWPGQIYSPIQQAIRPASFATTELGMTARIGETQVYASLSEFHQGAPLRFLAGYDRTSTRLNVTHPIATNLQAQLSTYYAHSLQNAPYAGENYPGSFLYLTRQRAATNLLAQDSLGRTYVRVDVLSSGQQNSNPVNPFNDIKDVGITDRFIGGLTLRYTPMSWLDFESNFSYDYRGYAEDYYYGKGRRVTSNAAATYWYRGYAERYAWTRNGYNGSLNATARHTFGRDLATKWSLRATFEQQDYQNNDGNGSLLNAVGIDQLGNATQSTYSITSYNESIRQIGLFAGVNLEYKDRYVVDALVRRDGSSLFGADRRWATFGRGSVAWRMAQEPWWPFKSVFNEFKLRASQGSAGGRPNFAAQYESFTVSSAGIQLGNLGNKDLRPETNTETEIGADIELFRRIGLMINHSTSTIKDQILQVVQPSSQGYLTKWMNAGTLENKTWELSLNIPVISKRDVQWSWRFNYDATTSVITALNVPPFYFGTSYQGTETMFQAKQGEAMGTFYGAVMATNCSQLPTAFRSDCGTATSSFQMNSDGWLVWVGHGNSPGDGITKNLWTTYLPGCVNHTSRAEQGCTLATSDTLSPWGVGLHWGMPIRVRNANGTRLIGALGHALPKWHFSVSQTFQWKRLSVYAMLEGLIGRDIWNEGKQWEHLDLNSPDVDQYGKSVHAAKPLGYYWRGLTVDGASAGVGGLYDILSPSSFWMEDGSFAKLRELSVGYRVGRVLGWGDWSLNLIGRNLFTITKYSGFDPEVGSSRGPSGTSAQGGASSAYINAVDAFNFPGTRSFTVSLTVGF
ncbi:MAG TPA: SusC/RagA family TonB-linked outer membrane protein [Gemmatimonadales bacterium]|nr:SusC/RagA family TonB-linked outer membrane protein [Gemmatimonadales bacterium]